MKMNKDHHAPGEAASPPKSIKPALLALAIAQALAFQTVQAASIEVTSNLDDGTDCTLREALATVNVGADLANGCTINTGVDALGTNDTIVFGPTVAGQTITTTQGDLPISNRVSINPEGVNTTIDGNLALRVIHITYDDSYTDGEILLNQLTITGGNIGVYVDFTSYADVTLTDSTISGNSGHGIRTGPRAGMALTNSTVSGNNGGGIYASWTSSVGLTNSTVSGNTGVGLDADYAGIGLTNSTVSGNTGRAVNLSNASIGLLNSTISGNGGGINAFGFAPSVYIANSVIDNNSGDESCYVEDTPYSSLEAGPDTVSTTPCGGATVADPLLGTLADNGGPTQTLALLPGSPAIDNGTSWIGTANDQRGVAAEGVRDSGAYEFTGAMNPLTIEKTINNRVRETPARAAQLLPGTRYRVDYKVTNNSPDRLYSVKVFEGGELVCNLYTLNPGQTKQPYRCASNQDVLMGQNDIPATVTAKITGSNQELADLTHAYYTAYDWYRRELKVTHYVNNRNADTQASAVNVNGNQAEVLFRVENTGLIELYNVKTYHDPASPINSGWQQQCFIGTMEPAQVRYCKRTISVTESGLNKAFGRAQGEDAKVSPTGYVNASNPSYYNVVLP